MTPKLRLLFTLLLGLILAGCATPYRAQSGSGGGYSDEKLGEGSYKIRYVASGETEVMEVYRMWHRRATELCGSDKYQYDVAMKLTTRDTDLTVPVGRSLISSPTQLLLSRTLEGTAKCGEQ